MDFHPVYMSYPSGWISNPDHADNMEMIAQAEFEQFEIMIEGRWPKNIPLR